MVLGVREGDTSDKYLGLPSLIGRRKKEILGFWKRENSEQGLKLELNILVPRR